MDVAYNQHARRNGRSFNNLTLAPLTSRLPISDADELPSSSPHISYLEGRSAPTTPSVLSRSSSKVSLPKPPKTPLPKSKSSTHLLNTQGSRHPQNRSTPSTPRTPGSSHRRGVLAEDLSISSLSQKDRSNSDWLLRAGATISSSTRESKGQAWLVSRASSTSLTGQLDEDEAALQQQLIQEREYSRDVSRRGSTAIAFDDADDEFSPVTTRRSLSYGPGSRPGSRPISRYASRRGSRAGVGEKEGDYFDAKHYVHGLMTEPDFVGVEDESSDSEGGENDDEAVVRKLARASRAGLAGWMEKLLGWSLFPVDEDGEETETDEKGALEEEGISRVSSSRNLELGVEAIEREAIPKPPTDGEAGGWQDAAWLLSVATKVIL